MEATKLKDDRNLTEIDGMKQGMQLTRAEILEASLLKLLDEARQSGTGIAPLQSPELDAVIAHLTAATNQVELLVPRIEAGELN